MRTVDEIIVSSEGPFAKTKSSSNYLQVKLFASVPPAVMNVSPNVSHADWHFSECGAKLIRSVNDNHLWSPTLKFQLPSRGYQRSRGVALHCIHLKLPIFLPDC